MWNQIATKVRVYNYGRHDCDDCGVLCGCRDVGKTLDSHLTNISQPVKLITGWHYQKGTYHENIRSEVCDLQRNR